MFQRFVLVASVDSLNLVICGVTFFCLLHDQAIVLCQVEKSKEDMLNKLYNSIRLVVIL
jgi:hypothetical protein